MKNLTLAKVGGAAYLALNAAQHIAYNLQHSISNLPAQYLSGKAADACELAAPGAAALALHSAASSIEDCLTPGRLSALRGSLPLAAATLGVAAILNQHGHHLGIPEGLGVMETAQHLLLNYRDAVIDLCTGKDQNGAYLTGALVTASSAGRLTKNFLGAVMKAGRSE